MKYFPKKNNLHYRSNKLLQQPSKLRLFSLIQNVIESDSTATAMWGTSTRFLPLFGQIQKDHSSVLLAPLPFDQTVSLQVINYAGNVAASTTETLTKLVQRDCTYLRQDSKYLELRRCQAIRREKPIRLLVHCLAKCNTQFSEVSILLNFTFARVHIYRIFKHLIINILRIYSMCSRFSTILKKFYPPRANVQNGISADGLHKDEKIRANTYNART